MAENGIRRGKHVSHANALFAENH